MELKGSEVHEKGFHLEIRGVSLGFQNEKQFKNTNGSKVT